MRISCASGDGSVGLSGVAHCDEREAAGPAGVAIGDEVDLVHCAVLLEQGPKARLGGSEIEVAYENVFHELNFLNLQRS